MSEEEKNSFEKLVDYWKKNVASNLKELSATIGSMITIVFALVLFGIKSELDLNTILITVVLALQPFFNVYINVIFKGKSEVKDTTNLMLTRELAHVREISQYKIQLASVRNLQHDGIIANKDWNDSNDMIGKHTNSENLTKQE